MRTAASLRPPLVVALLYGLAASTLAAADVHEEAARLRSEGRPRAAYRLLRTCAEAHAADPEHDYEVGLAAADAGMPRRAIEALRRVLEAQPDNGPARAELGRAYFLLGDLAAAREHFNGVMEETPPAGARRSVQRFLSAIDAIESADDTRVTGHVGLGVGWDSNVSSATSDDSVAVPALGDQVVLLDPTALEEDDLYVPIRAGAQLVHPLRMGFSFFAAGNLSSQRNLEEQDFDTLSVEAHFGWQWVRGADRVRLFPQGRVFRVGGDTFRRLVGLNLEWQHRVDENDSVTLFARAAAQRFPDARVRDTDDLSAGLSWVHSFATPRRPVGFLTVVAGVEDARDDSRPDLGETHVGVRAGVSADLDDWARFFIRAGFTRREFDGEDPSFLREREDERFTASVGVRCKVGRQWTVTPLASYTRNESNIPISEFDRLRVQVLVRRTFQ